MGSKWTRFTSPAFENKPLNHSCRQENLCHYTLPLPNILAAMEPSLHVTVRLSAQHTHTHTHTRTCIYTHTHTHTYLWASIRYVVNKERDLFLAATSPNGRDVWQQSTRSTHIRVEQRRLVVELHRIPSINVTTVEFVAGERDNRRCVISLVKSHAPVLNLHFISHSKD